MKIQFGANDNLLDGWVNLRNETDGDITRPLEYGDSTVDFILIEHVLEHVTHQSALDFLFECRRVLKMGGVVRIIVPDVMEIWEWANDDYLQFIGDNAEQWWAAAGRKWPGHGKATPQEALATIIYCHGHKGLYTGGLLRGFCYAAGLSPHTSEYGHSMYHELQGVDSHWKQMGLARARLESVVVEAIKVC